ncbi:MULTISPECIES: redoxin family protein [Methylomonas]|uniref:Thiol-disulfide isomerase n=2 Tax=Methylomonas TaxID=416 RepID=A0A126T624_9GAMM|nr:MULTISPECIES: redoxin family protein [Methylomonas]AMK77527.1 thiol-disulfide isomerase [Methylomonas denitrificans]OAI05108.1 thiol-disulfide isomerase [Methylomonas methanica]TCV84431.1 redoxin [Methylomonas methanica]
MKTVMIGQKVPPLSVSEWVQGQPVNFEQLRGKVVLVAVFQVNCPGCFLSCLPQVLALKQRYAESGLTVLGLATAFEDFDKNNLENLKRLIETGEVVGETLRVLGERGILQHGKLPYRIDFPVAMDRLTKREFGSIESEIDAFISQRLSDLEQEIGLRQPHVRAQVKEYLQMLDYHAETFEFFQLQGTPSYILVDKNGFLAACRFGAYPDLEADILKLL